MKKYFWRKPDWRDLTALGILIGIFINSLILTYTRDISLPYHVWIRSFSQDTYKKGDYVMLRYDVEDAYIQGMRIIKKITCIPGERILRSGDGVFCNGYWLGDIIKNDKHGKPLPEIWFNEIIPEDYFFIQGTHKRSYDSRYFGLVPKKMFHRKVYPVMEILGAGK